ncbi:MAG: hypothetical protein ACK5CE_11445 [Actinomycetes bacterium]
MSRRRRSAHVAGIRSDDLTGDPLPSRTRPNGDRTVTVTLGPTCSGTCTAIGTQPSNATFSFQPATTIRDTAGNLILTTTRSSSIRLF